MYDAIVIGARCAGATTAFLLARAGLDVLLVDRGRFPSEIPHGHFIHRHGPADLARWGLLDPLLERCPPVTSASLDFGTVRLSASDLVVGEVPMGVGPRRATLDAVLVEAAVAAGAELREGFAVEDLEWDGDRVIGVRSREGVRELGRVVIGADGRNSRMAQRTGAPITHYADTLSCWYFSYWSGVEPDGLEITVRDRRATFAFPTDDGLFALFVAWPIGELPRVRADIEGEFLAVVDAVPGLRERVRAGRREERFLGATRLPNFLRRPYGAGWALVGDAACHKDPFLALGLCDALRDAELLADAVVRGLGSGELHHALAAYGRERDAATLADFEENLEAARLEPPDRQAAALMGALRGRDEDVQRFFLAREGMVPRESFFNVETMRRLFAG